MLALYQFPPHNILHRLRGPHRPGSTFRSWIKYTVCVLHIGWTPCARSLADLATPNWVEPPDLIKRAVYEGDYLGRRLGAPSSSGDLGCKNAVATGLRQADDLLSAFGADDGRNSRNSYYFLSRISG